MSASPAFSQVIINEGTNRNYSGISDEDGEYPDWVELYNSGSDTVFLQNYTLSDDPANPARWVFPNVYLLPGEYKTVFCSGKDRKPISGFKHVLNTGPFTAVVGWNVHPFSTPFYWDGISNILINTCSYRSTGYTTNSVFNQSIKPYNATICAFQDGSPYICTTNFGSPSNKRPNMKLNDITIDTGHVQNTTTDYPAPYGNWYWAAKNQMLIPAAELLSAGLTAGDITSLAFDVASTDTNTQYDYVDFYMKLVSVNAVTSFFDPVDTNNNLHTNFKISSAGETVYLYSPAQTLLSQLLVNCNGLDNSNGRFPDASASPPVLFEASTPSATNNLSATYSGYLQQAFFSVQPGMYNAAFNVHIYNTNGAGTSIRYTLDGSDPTLSSALFNGVDINIFYSCVLKARVFGNNMLPSKIRVASYLMGISHQTPVLSVVTDKKNLFGPGGIFDHWEYDWEKAAYVDYFDSTRQLIFSQNAGIQIDGGAGGSRSNSQHSFRVELDNGVLGDGPIDYALIPNRPYRTKFSKFYLRNGSNQYLTYPYKDACQVEAMGRESNNYYSAWRPVSVYINGAYYGLYELREKFDTDLFKVIDDANPDSVDILSQSYWYGGALRPTVGSVAPFYNAVASFNNLNPADTAFWTLADHDFDMIWYNDYIIAESWIANKDWPWNNIKIYRSDKTHYRWRFCLVDLELSLAPNGWSDCYFDHINYMLNQDMSIPSVGIWRKGIQNARFRNYFINRFADLMNTTYQFSRLSAIDDNMFNQTVLEMQSEYQRWGDPNNLIQLMTNFSNNHLTFQYQLSQRTAQVRNHLQSNFSLAGQVDVTLDVIPAGAGKIKISTIIPSSLPWTGVYFNGNPVKLTVIPKPGYNFLYWAANAVMPSPNNNPSITLNITSDAVFTAVFMASSFKGKLSISELNFHSDTTRDAGDWIEFHNYGNGPLDVSGWRFTDSVVYHRYYFPAATIIAPGAYLVLAEDSLKFHEQHPGVAILGSPGFGFSNSDEALCLFDNANDLVLRMHYDDSIPWQQAADGYGRTLELLNDSANPSMAASWFAGCIGGSAGGPYTPCPEPVIFSEINYSSSATADAGDWVELHNTATSAVDLSGWEFRDGDDTHSFTIPSNTVLSASAYLVIYSDHAKFSNRFPAVTNIKGPFAFGLGSSGEAIRLFNNSGKICQSVFYDEAAPWPLGAAGNGYTLELLDPDGHFCDGTNWFAGCPGGSPGEAYATPCPIGIDVLNQEADIKLVPNPSQGRFSIVFNGAETRSTELIIYNFLGGKIFQAIYPKGISTLSVDISDSPPGLYFARISAAGKVFEQKIVIE
ncbi:MAG: lamin tail domain-containing protein [Bacteroidota bacterium]